MLWIALYLLVGVIVARWEYLNGALDGGVDVFACMVLWPAGVLLPLAGWLAEILILDWVFWPVDRLHAWWHARGNNDQGGGVPW